MVSSPLMLSLQEGSWGGRGEPMGLGKITFTLAGRSVAKGAIAEALDEDATGHFQPGGRRTVTLKQAGKGFTLTDAFAPLAAHIYRIGAPESASH